jgi:hypothetical protein
MPDLGALLDIADFILLYNAPSKLVLGNLVVLFLRAILDPDIVNSEQGLSVVYEAFFDPPKY